MKRGRPFVDLPCGLSAAQHEVKRHQLGLSMRRYARLIGVPQATFIQKVQGITEQVATIMAEYLEPLMIQWMRLELRIRIEKEFDDLPPSWRNPRARLRTL